MFQSYDDLLLFFLASVQTRSHRGAKAHKASRGKPFDSHAQPHSVILKITGKCLLFFFA